MQKDLLNINIPYNLDGKRRGLLGRRSACMRL